MSKRAKIVRGGAPYVSLLPLRSLMLARGHRVLCLLHLFGTASRWVRSGHLEFWLNSVGQGGSPILALRTKCGGIKLGV